MISKCLGSKFPSNDTGHRSRASGKRVWFVYANVFTQISKALSNGNPESKNFFTETSKSIHGRAELLNLFSDKWATERNDYNRPSMSTNKRMSSGIPIDGWVSFSWIATRNKRRKFKIMILQVKLLILISSIFSPFTKLFSMKISHPVVRKYPNYRNDFQILFLKPKILDRSNIEPFLQFLQFNHKHLFRKTVQTWSNSITTTVFAWLETPDDILQCGCYQEILLLQAKFLTNENLKISHHIS